MHSTTCPGHVAFEGRGNVLSNKTFFPQSPVSLTANNTGKKEPEAHTSGACLLQMQLAQAGFLEPSCIFARHIHAAIAGRCLPVVEHRLFGPAAVITTRRRNLIVTTQH